MNTIRITTAPVEPSFKEITLEGFRYFKSVNSEEYTVVAPTFYRQYTFGVFRETTHFMITMSITDSAVITATDQLWKVFNEGNWQEIDEQTALDGIQAGLLKGLDQVREATI